MIVSRTDIKQNCLTFDITQTSKQKFEQEKRWCVYSSDIKQKLQQIQWKHVNNLE